MTWSRDLKTWPNILASRMWRYVFVYGMRRVTKDRYVIVGQAQGEPQPGLMGDYCVGFAVEFDGEGKEIWSQTYDMAERVALSDIEAVGEKGFLFVGQVADRLRNDSDILLLRVDPRGKILWQKRHGGDGSDGASHLLRGGKGRLFAVGITTSNSKGGDDALVLLLSENGDVEGQLTLGGKGIDYAKDACRAENGGIIICGTTEVPGKYAQAFVARIVIVP